MIRKRSKPAAVCPFLRSIGKESPEPVARPDFMHRCMANQQRREVTPRTQNLFCLADQHTTCPFFTGAMPGKAPADTEDQTS